MTGETPNIVRVLREGDLKIEGRLTDASNATLYCTAVLDDARRQRIDGADGFDGAGGIDGADALGGRAASDEPDALGQISVTCVYKPIAGERPLWDFPPGTLAAREVAAYEVSAAAGWDVVPPTLLRDGPYGPGMCQLWIDVVDDAERLLAVLPEAAGDSDAARTQGWCPVIAVTLADDSQGLLAHRDDDRLRRIALFDAVINNADRKGGHLLPDDRGRVYAIDHGVSFHVEDKLRTLLWGFAGRALSDAERADLDRLRADRALARRLAELLGQAETEAFHRRIDELLTVGRLPGPQDRRRPIPWPPV